MSNTSKFTMERVTKDGDHSTTSLDVPDSVIGETLESFTDFRTVIHMDPVPDDKEDWVDTIYTMMTGACMIANHDHQCCMASLAEIASFLGQTYEINACVAFDNHLKRGHIFLNYLDDEVKTIMKAEMEKHPNDDR
jgi:hypothetical protein